MSLLLYSLIKQAAELGLSAMHRAERPLYWLQSWAWRRAVNQNLKSCNTRSAGSVKHFIQ